MPYRIVHKKGGGFRVAYPKGGKLHYLSKHPLTHAKAIKQLYAVRIHSKEKFM